MLMTYLQSLCDHMYTLSWNRITPEYLLGGLALLALSLLLGVLLRRRFPGGAVQVLALCLLLFYLYLLIGGTIVCRRPRAAFSYILRPFWSYVTFRRATTRGMILRNCLMLFPVGFLLPLLFPRRRFRFSTMLLCAFCLTYCIEVLQLVLKKGTFELVDDPLHNVLGALLGYGCCQLVLTLRRTAAARRGEEEKRGV